MELTETGRRKTKDGTESHSLNLADTVKLWPTPNTLDGLKPKSLDKIMEYNWKARPGRSYASMNLREQVVYGHQEIWPTPQARDWKGASGRSMKGQECDLPMKVKQFPTPTQRDYKGARNRKP